MHISQLIFNNQNRFSVLKRQSERKIVSIQYPEIIDRKNDAVLDSKVLYEKVVAENVLYTLSQISIPRNNQSEKMHSSASILKEKEQQMSEGREQERDSSRDNSLTTRRKYRNDFDSSDGKKLSASTVRALARLGVSSSRMDQRGDRRAM